MQTFLPHSDFAESARSLDRQRLGKQRVETMQILRTLRGERDGWRGHENALVAYGLAICSEWTARGYRDTCAEKIAALADEDGSNELPPWLGDDAFHQSHRSKLVRKDPAHYRPQFPDVPDDLDDVWPLPSA